MYLIISFKHAKLKIHIISIIVNATVDFENYSYNFSVNKNQHKV